MIRLFLTIACCAAQVVVIAQSDVPIYSELLARSNELMNAAERQDRAALELILADEFMLESPGNTAAVPRAEWIDNAVNLKWEGFKFHNLKVRSFGEVAVVSSLLNFKVKTGIGPTHQFSCTGRECFVAPRRSMADRCAAVEGGFPFWDNTDDLGFCRCTLPLLFGQADREGKEKGQDKEGTGHGVVMVPGLPSLP